MRYQIHGTIRYRKFITIVSKPEQLNDLKCNGMNIENSKAQMRRGILEYCILQVLSNKPLYASDIIGELKEAKMIVVEGTLYPLLNRLKNEKMLTYQWEESSQGPPRKYYELTPMGHSFLNELDKSWSDLVESVARISEHHRETNVTEKTENN